MKKISERIIELKKVVLDEIDELKRIILTEDPLHFDWDCNAKNSLDRIIYLNSLIEELGTLRK